MLYGTRTKHDNGLSYWNAYSGVNQFKKVKAPPMQNEPLFSRRTFFSFLENDNVTNRKALYIILLHNTRMQQKERKILCWRLLIRWSNNNNIIFVAIKAGQQGGWTDRWMDIKAVSQTTNSNSNSWLKFLHDYSIPHTQNLFSFQPKVFLHFSVGKVGSLFLHFCNDFIFFQRVIMIYAPMLYFNTLRKNKQDWLSP